MTPELTYLVWGVALLIVHILLQATVSDLSKGLNWALSSQDDQKEGSPVSGRIERALANYLQTFVGFAALALTLAVAGKSDANSAMEAAIWFWARVAYVPAYASGIPLVRSLCWFASMIGIVIMLFTLI